MNASYHYAVNLALEAFHARNHDWAAVLRDKWSLARWAQEGGN